MKVDDRIRPFNAGTEEDLEEELSSVQPFYDLIAQYPLENDREILAR